MMKKSKYRNNKGITMITLVITVILLGIIAGVTIEKFRGESIIKNSKIAVEKFDEKEFNERLELVVFNTKQAYMLSVPLDESGNKMTIQLAVIKAMLKEFEGSSAINNYIKIPNIEKSIKVSEDGKISIVDGIDFLEGYRKDQLKSGYKLKTVWDATNINCVNLSHYSRNFYGAS